MAKKIKITVSHEQVILGCMLNSRELRKKILLRQSISDFASQRHKVIFAALAELEERKLEYTPGTLKTFLPDSDWGGIEYLDLLEKRGSEKNLRYHTERAKWDLSRSQILQEQLPDLETTFKDPRADIDEVIRKVKMIEERLSAIRHNNSVISGKGLSAQYKAKLFARESRDHIRESGYDALDNELTSPFAPGLITVIAAAPSIGKTTFALNLAQRQCRNWKVGYLAWESGTIQATDILCASALQIPLIKLVKYPNKLSDSERQIIYDLLENIYERKNGLSFLQTPPQHLFKNAHGPWEINDRVIDWFESQIAEWDRDIIYWDLFEKKLADTKPHSIVWALNRIQTIAQNYNVHIVLLHQITFKELEKRTNKRPTRGILKGSGAYLEVPDFVFTLYRDAVYNPDVDDNIIDVDCQKQRTGPFPFRIRMKWEGRFCRISGGNKVKIDVIEDELGTI